MPMQIYISSDHAGFELKNRLVEFLQNVVDEVKDLGPSEFDPSDDYPDYAADTAREVSMNNESKGILICRNGVGVCIAANKFNGIRAVNGNELNIAVSSRLDDDTNILCLGADYIDLETAKTIVKSWLQTEFSGEERHKRRIAKISYTRAFD